MLDESQRPAYFLYMVQEWLTLVLNLVVAGMAVMLVSLALELRANVGITGASLVTVITLGDNLNITVQQWTRLETSISAVKRIRDFNETVKPEGKPSETVVPREDWPSTGRIELRNVSAAYDAEAPDEKPNLALRNIDLEILPGEKVAICGRTGSGKSSTIALLLKLLDPVPGTPSEIMVDGVSLHDVNRAILRRRFVALPQEAVLLPDGSSYRQNLDPLDMGASDGDCRRVLELVNLWTVVESSGGLDASVTSTSFSHGQQQLFALAQAVLRRQSRAIRLAASGSPAPGGVLLLDEATSSVDRETERLMQRIIREEFKSWTIVAVSHRLEMIMDFDKVVVMDKGEVVETGNPTTLVALEGSKFGKLWKAAKGE
ncbi:hypothetical protein LTS14_002391 [Recurvomyces mirabilis]|uniref:uncharacterized protein n=1 Tax=Recurvomyces mirabilis TaxID=574656 RepID=UPI002DE0A1D4|nr:hypothetical protein LTS14_002391 [Recurvomyces mirabilis]